MKINISDEIGNTDAAQRISDDSPAFDYEKIKADVRSRTTEIEKPKRNGKRIRLFAVLAAAIVVCTVSAALLAVSGVFSNTFVSDSQEESSETDINDKNNVRFESEVQGLEGKLLSLTTDDNILSAKIELTKVDGETFSDEGYTNLKDGYCVNADSGINMANCYVNPVSQNGDQISIGNKKSVYSVQYTLSDDRRTMTMTLDMNTDSSIIQKGRLTLSNNFYTAYKVIKNLAEFENNNFANAPLIREICTTNSIPPSATNMAYNGRNWELQQIEYQNHDLPFVMEIDLKTESN